MQWHPDRNRGNEETARLRFDEICDALDALVGKGAAEDEYSRMSFKGSGWVGREVYRFWEDEGGWLKASVSNWDPVTGEHTLTYMAGTDEEAEEEVNLDSVDPAEMQLPEDRVRDMLSVGCDARPMLQDVAVACESTEDTGASYEGLRGRRFPRAWLEKAKKEAVLQGLRYMERLLKEDIALGEMGEQAIGMFYDVARGAQDEEVAQEASRICRELLRRMQRIILSTWELPVNRVKFVQLLSMLQYTEIGWDPEPIACFADEAFREFRGTDEVVGFKFSRLGVRSTDDWYFIVIDLYILENANLVCPGRYPLDWGLKEALPLLWQHLRQNPMPSPPAKGAFSLRFQDSFYLVTHLICVLAGWNRLVDPELEPRVPWLYAYAREGLEYLIGEAFTGREDGGKTHVDLDAVAEGLDACRSIEANEDVSPLACEATVWLLEQQQKDGGWPARWHPEDAKRYYGAIYDAIHPAWVATFALTNRNPSRGGPWEDFVVPLLREASFEIDPRSSYVHPKEEAQLMLHG